MLDQEHILHERLADIGLVPKSQEEEGLSRMNTRLFRLAMMRLGFFLETSASR